MYQFGKLLSRYIYNELATISVLTNIANYITQENTLQPEDIHEDNTTKVAPQKVHNKNLEFIPTPQIYTAQ